MGNTLLNQENIRRELLELTQQTASKAINDTDNTIAKFLKGEIELSIGKINELKTDFYNNWIKEKELTPRQKRQLERYSLKEYFDLPDDEGDEKVEQLLRDSTERKRDFQLLMNIAEDGKEALGKQWNKDDIFKFTNGTSETRARMFLSEGKGFTSLESPAYVPGEKYLSRTGLQIAPYGTGIGERSYDYARMQSSRFKDRPVIIEGEIPAQYVYRNTNGSAEFGIPHQYYDKISSAKILDAETMQELYHLDNGKLVKSETFTEPKLPELKIKELNKSVIQQSKPKLDTESEPDISNKRIKEINKDKNSFVNKHFTSPTLKKLKRESKDSIFFKLDKSVILPLELDFNKNGISVFGNDTTAFILAHGADDGKISLRRNGERLLLSSKELTGSLEDMLPDTIKDIYTINCYGGKQKEYYTNRGIHVQSIHQDKIPIESLQDVNSKNKVFGILTTQKKLSKEITDNIYKNVYKNKLLSETPNLKNILLPEQLEEVINGLYLKQWQNIKNKKSKTKKSNKKPKSKKQNKKSKPKKQINKNVDNIELPKQNQRKPKVLGERLKQQQIQKDVLSKKSIQEQQTLLDLKKSIDKPVNQKTERKLQKKELSHQELYDLNKNNNQGIKQKINNVNTTSKNTNTPKVKGEKLDIIGNRKDMAMMVDILKNNGQKTANETAAQIAKNICSSGNRYGKGAISILSKIV